MKSYVFSVNQHDIAVDCGMLGVYIIKGANGKIFGKTTIDDRKSLRDMGNDRFEAHIDSGADIAKDIVLRNEEDGFFLAASGEPSPDEIRDATNKYKDLSILAVRNADVIWEKTRNREVIPERARRAARFIGATPEWLDQTTGDTKECPRCAESIKAKATFCRHCQLDLNAPPVKAAPVAKG